MIPIRRSQAVKPNPHVSEAPRRAKETNRQWLARVADERVLGGQVLLLGGTGLTDFRLRVAQSHSRQDLTPSLFSHAAIIAGPARAAKGRDADWVLHEVSLEPPGGFGAVAKLNGVQEGRLSRYDDGERWPNIAVLRFLDGKEAAARVEGAVVDYRRERRLVDTAALLVEWLAFVWGAGAQGNPLLREAGVPGAAFVGQVFAFLDVELTPGLSSRAASPEAIWQAARWWHDFYDKAVGSKTKAPRGHFSIGQPAASCQSE